MNTKSKAVLYAALGVIGIVGASASAGKNVQAPVYSLEVGEFNLLDPSEQNQPGGWACNAGSNTCIYQKINPSGDTTASNMTRAETGTFNRIEAE
jgi:hypothetical protein